MTTPSQQLEAVYAAAVALRPHAAVIDNAQPLRAQLEKEVTELKTEKESLQRTNSELLRQQNSYRHRLEELKDHEAKYLSEMNKLKGQLQLQIDLKTKELAELQAQQNRILQSMQAMLKVQQ